jgi:uncharacterized protein (UPF0303 family)
MSKTTDAGADLLETLKRQEKLGVFQHFSENEAFDLGSMTMAIARAQHAPVVVDIRTSNRILFHAALPGSSPDNDEWVRRKSNITLRFNQSSLLYGQLLAEKQRNVGPEIGLDLKDYAAHGGSFPIRFASGGLVVAALTVSGLPQRDDHRMAVEAISAYLKVDLPRI